MESDSSLNQLLAQIYLKSCKVIAPNDLLNQNCFRMRFLGLILKGFDGQMIL